MDLRPSTHIHFESEADRRHYIRTPHCSTLLDALERRVQNALIARAKLAKMARGPEALKRHALRDSPEIEAALADGEDAFWSRVVTRIFTDHSEAINRCPFCWGLCRTPESKQCRWCHRTWHDLDSTKPISDPRNRPAPNEPDELPQIEAVTFETSGFGFVDLEGCDVPERIQAFTGEIRTTEVQARVAYLRPAGSPWILRNRSGQYLQRFPGHLLALHQADSEGLAFIRTTGLELSERKALATFVAVAKRKMGWDESPLIKVSFHSDPQPLFLDPIYTGKAWKLRQGKS